MKKALLALLSIILLSCGYKPTAHYVNRVLGKKIYIDVTVDRAEPESSVYIKDELAKIVYKRFHATLSPKNQADSHIVVSYSSTISPLSYDRNGFVSKYRINLAMIFQIKSKKRGNIIKRIHSSYESDIEQSGKNQATLRIEATKKGVAIALDEFVSYITMLGAK
jgi:hypothetical protein